MTSSRARAVLADDHSVVRAGLRNILERSGTVEVVAEAEDGRTLLAAVHRTRPDIVILDVSMPGMNGVDATRLIVREHPGTPVLILSVHCSEGIVLDAIEAGATGYVLKDAAPSELERAVQVLLAHQSYFSPAVASVLANRLTTGGVRREMLTAREREVVQLMCEGHRLHEVATRLFVSVSTVKTHRANAMRKVGARSTAALIRYAIRNGLSSL
jgi:two-component system, NarL family, response regulator NreC